MNEESKVNSLVDQLFNKNGGAKKVKQVKRERQVNQKKNKQGGDVITPFLSALALLGTRIANDKRFLNSKFNLNVSDIKKRSSKRRYKEEITGGDQNAQNISNMMSSLGALSGNAQAAAPKVAQVQAPSALTGGKHSRKRGGNGDAAAAAAVLAPSHPHNNAPQSHQEYFAAQNNAPHSAEQEMPPQLPATGGKRRSVNHKKRSVSPKRRSASPKRRAAPKKATRRT